MLLLWNKIKKIYSPCLVSVVHLAYFIASFQNKTDEVMSGQSCFERPEPRGRFLAEIRIGCSIFAPNTKKEKSFVLFSGRLVKISSFLLQFERFLPCFFNFLPHPATVDNDTARKINISDRSSRTTSTYHTGAAHSRKFPLKIYSSPHDPTFES